LKKIKKETPTLVSKKSYEAVCSIGRLFEKEVEILRLIRGLINKYQKKNKCSQEL